MPWKAPKQQVTTQTRPFYLHGYGTYRGCDTSDAPGAITPSHLADEFQRLVRLIVDPEIKRGAAAELFAVSAVRDKQVAVAAGQDGGIAAQPERGANQRIIENRRKRLRRECDCRRTPDQEKRCRDREASRDCNSPKQRLIR
jgi:hypothetical protein